MTLQWKWIEADYFLNPVFPFVNSIIDFLIAKADITSFSSTWDKTENYKSLWIYTRQACLTLLRVSSCGDMSYNALSQSVPSGFITVAFWMERLQEENWSIMLLWQKKDVFRIWWISEIKKIGKLCFVLNIPTWFFVFTSYRLMNLYFIFWGRWFLNVGHKFQKFKVES